MSVSLWIRCPLLGAKALSTFFAPILPRYKPRHIFFYSISGKFQIDYGMFTFTVTVQLAAAAVRAYFCLDKNCLLGLVSCNAVFRRPLVDQFELLLAANQHFLPLVIKPG